MKWFFSVLFVALLATNKSFATNLRGQIVRYNQYSRSYFPLSGVRADIWIWNGSQWVPVGYYVTGPDGFYYFYNVVPGYAFRIQVWGNFFPPEPLTVQPVNPPYFQDIPWIIT